VATAAVVLVAVAAEGASAVAGAASAVVDRRVAGK